MDFGDALHALRRGERVTREGWNGPGQWLLLVAGSRFTVETGRPLGDSAPDLVGTVVDYRPHIDIRTTQGSIVPWVATQSDLLADDWHTVTPAPAGEPSDG